MAENATPLVIADRNVDSRYIRPNETIRIEWSANGERCRVVGHEIELPVCPCPFNCRDKYGRPGYRFGVHCSGVCHRYGTCRYAVAWRPQTLERIAVGRVKRCPVCNWLFLVSGGRRWDKHENAACYSPGCRYTWAEWCKYPDLHCVVCGHFTNKIVRFDAGVLPSFLWPTAIIATTEAYVCAEGSCERLHRLEMNGTMLANVLYTMASVTMREVRLRLVEWILQAIELAGNACIYCQKQLEDGETLTQVAVAPRVPLYGWNELVADMPLCAECRESTLEPLTQEAVV